MGLKELTILAAGCLLAESRAKGSARRMDWESAAGFLLEAVTLAWHLALLAGLNWAVQTLSLSVPQAKWTGMALTLICAYGLSFWRRRPEGGTEVYFLALTALMLTNTGEAVRWEDWRLWLSLWGGSLACAAVLLGLKERLRWTPVLPAAEGLPIVLLCLALLAVITHSLGF